MKPFRAAKFLRLSVVLILAALVRSHAVDSLDALKQAAKALAPGAVVELSDGTFPAKGAIKIAGVRGTEEKPIILRAQNRGKAVVAGAAGFILKDCEHVVIEGFLFTHDADQQAVMLDNCRHVRVTRNTFRLTERAKPQHWEHWVTVDGARSGWNRIDHNLFERKVNRGSPLFVRGDDAELVCSQHDRIDHNHFRDIIYANGENGHETIRTGGNDLGASDRGSFTIIEDNLLERCCGEDELMSLKSSDNTVRNNTLLNCRGAICLRLCNRTVVSGNFIISTDGAPGSGGVKLYGFEHRVFNNYFYGLTGRRHEAPFSLVPGTLDTPDTRNIGSKYDDNTSSAPTRCWIAFNTWVDCASLQFGFPKEKDRPCLPNECSFVNNLVVRTKPQKTPLVNMDLVRNLRVAGNLGYAEGPAQAGEWTKGFRFADPHLRYADGVWRLTESNAAIDDPTKIDEDIFGRARVGKRDIGAEEFSSAPLVRSPLSPDEVGPEAPESR
jgi:parallel beta-helix repeat protein